MAEIRTATKSRSEANGHSLRVRGVAAAGLLAACGAALGQPIRETPEGVWVTVPYQIKMIVQEQRFELVTMEAGPLPRGAVPGVLPRHVPVVTVFPDGRQKDGFYLYNWLGQDAISFPFEEIGVVLFDRVTGRYQITTDQTDVGVRWGIVNGVRRCTGEKYPDKWEARDTRRSTAIVAYSESEVRQPTRASWDLTFIIPDPAPAGIDRGAVVRITGVVSDRFRRVLGTNRGPVAITLDFAAPQSGGIAQTFPRYRDRGVSEVHIGFGFQYTTDAEEDAAPVWENFPQSTSIGVEWNGLINSVQTIRSPRAVEPQMNLSQVSAADEATIQINPAVAWDFDSGDGIDAGKTDFEYMLTHETIHALGFSSNVDDGQTQHLKINLFDLFRFSGRSSVSAQAFQTGLRRLVDNDETRSVSGLVLGSSPHTHRMAAGVFVNFPNGFAGDHWNDRGDEGSTIGIMIPDVDAGPIAPHIPDYIYESDWRALDAIGWNIDFGLGQVCPAGNQALAPTPGQSFVNPATVFSWTVGGLTDSSSLFVYSGSQVLSSNRVIAATGLLGTQYAVLPGILQDRATYTWVITGVNQFGSTPSAPSTFSTTCYANCDGSTTAPVLNIADFVVS